MKISAWVAASALVISGICAFTWARTKAIHRVQAVSAPAAPVMHLGEPEKHKVTPAMLTAAETHSDTIAPTFRIQDSDGVMQDLDVLVKDGPVVIIFIKDGCPCSVSAESYFNNLHALYGGRLRFLGVFDGDAAKARRWASLQGVPFPILPDPKVELTQRFGVTNSAFVALIDSSGKINSLWPGYSSSMLKDLNRRAAGLAGIKEELLETSDAPEDLYSGCPFSDS